MSMIKLLAKRLAYALGLILAVLSINFALIHAAPGDPAMVIAGEMGGADQTTLDQIRKTYGLDRPLTDQYITYITRAAQGDLGQSYLYNQPVTDLILQRLPATVLLVLSALLTAIAVGTMVGVWASRRPHSVGSGAVTVLSLVGYSMPTFWTGILLVILFGKIIPIMPIAGMRDVRIYGGWWVTSLDVLHHLILHRVHGPVQPAIAGQHAGGAELRLHPHRTSQRPGRAAGDLEARPAQCPDAGGHHCRSAVWQSGLGCGAGRDGLFVAGAGNTRL